MPSILYGNELWNGLSVTDVEQINRCQHYIVKAIQGFHKYTRSDMCESMLGLPPLVGQTVQRKRFKIMSLSAGTTCKDILVRRYLHLFSRISTSYVWKSLCWYM